MRFPTLFTLERQVSQKRRNTAGLFCRIWVSKILVHLYLALVLNDRRMCGRMVLWRVMNLNRVMYIGAIFSVLSFVALSSVLSITTVRSGWGKQGYLLSAIRRCSWSSAYLIPSGNGENSMMSRCIQVAEGIISPKVM